MIEPVTSLDDERLDPYARLTDLQLRSRIEPAKGICIAESPKVITCALDAGLTPLSLLTTEHLLPCLTEILDRLDPAVPIFIAPESELEKLTGFELTRGALCALRRPKERSVEDVVENAHLIVIMENIRNHTNVGAIFRSAAALGADAVLVSPACYDPLYRRAIRVSMGTVFKVPWARIGTNPRTWSREGVALLHSLGFTVVAMALSDDALSIDDARLHACDKLALVFGTEGDGLAKATLSNCDYSARIPMLNGVDSLNVAASSAVALWEFRRK